MKVLLTRLTAFAGRHWLRIGLIGCALLLFSQKQIDFNVRLGHPGPDALPAANPDGLAPAPVVDTEEPLLMSESRPSVAEAGGFFSRFNFFGSATPDRFEELSLRSSGEVDAFVTRFRHVAEAEQEKFGIPVSITLATGLLYSRAGQAAGAREANNYFGLGCGSDWAGPTGRAAGDCIRSYETAWTSFRDFSLYLSSGPYAQLAQFGPRDYHRWAAGMQELGFNANGNLASELQRTIDRFQLFRFD
ncbi:glucosaminidase domain-containing protein [Lewinella sp. IMCC34183]|uniref:glucosaminidase domain-containing protein n=1 Tax=Lewinella sp. IMCC34183 TaxID=2248762 RepID=UPI000E221DC7|nr:glucosaminidase domain-containing protein [Lewinella sp. IMCC34183]